MKKMVSVLLLTVLLLGFGLCGCKRKEREKERTVYEITVEYMPAERALTGTVKVDFYNSSEAELDSVKFMLYPNAYRKGRVFSPIAYDVETEAYYAGESYGEITVSSVLGGANYEVTGADKNILDVRLATPLAPSGRVTLDVGFSTRLANVNHRLGITKATVNLVGAFPVLCGLTKDGFYETVYYDVGDPFFADCADYEMKLTAPKEFVLAMTGGVCEENWLESKKRYTVSATNVRELAFALSTEFHCFEQRTGKTSVKYYALGKDGDVWSRFAADAVAFYSASFGECFGAELALVETDIVRESADHAGLCLLSSKLAGEEMGRAIAKEIASQWWYAAVGVNRVEYAWLVEGLAEYSVALFMEKRAELGGSKADFIQSASERYYEYKNNYQNALGWVDTRMNRPLSSFLNTYEYERIVEDRAVLMFAELEKSIGSKKFLSGLRKYYSENVGGQATPAHLVGAFERIGVELQGFFEGYCDGKETFFNLTKKS